METERNRSTIVEGAKSSFALDCEITVALGCDVLVVAPCEVEGASNSLALTQEISFKHNTKIAS